MPKLGTASRTGKGFSCVAWNSDYPGVLVNMELRRFALIEKACKHSCVEDRNFALEEFMDEVFSPWEAGQTDVRNVQK